MHDLPSHSAVAVTLPASTAYLRHVRVLTATVADDLGFDVEAIESLRVAVDELCALAITDIDGDGGTLTLTLDTDADGLVLRGESRPVSTDPEVDPIAEQLLRAGATSHTLRRDGDRCILELHAARPASADGR